MKKWALLLIVAVALVGNAANATSLIKVPEDRIRAHLAELSVIGFRCNKFNLRHNAIDLVWDILELKTGADPNSDSEVEKSADHIEKIDAAFKTDLETSCNEAYKRYGPDGSVIRDIIYLKD